MGDLMETVSEARLAQVHPLLASKVRAAAAQLAAQGTYIRVTQGLRTYDEQTALYDQGRTAPGHIVTNARAGYSNHNFGFAVDCIPFLSGQGGELNWNPNSQQFRAMVAALKAQGLVWGGDWHGIVDPPHFQLAETPTTPTDEDRALFLKAKLPGVWRSYPQLTLA